MAHIEKYKVPRNLIDVEAIAQTMARYLIISSEDTEFLSYDPTRRDQIIAQLQAQPGFKRSSWPCDIVGGSDLPLEKYDEYLAKADAGIAQLTPPKSLEE